MSQEDIIDMIAAHMPEGIMQYEVCKTILGFNGGGYVSTQITQLRKKRMIRRENENGKWRLFVV